MTEKRFRIALSFAGDQRPFVAEVARLLALQLGEERVLYDKFHTAEFARADLALYLPRLYHDEADLVVAVLCDGYADKEWCGLEWNAIFGLLKQGRQQQVMLTRFDLAEAVGLHGLEGYCDLDGLSAPQAAALVLERLALTQGLARDHYALVGSSTPAPDWPLEPPALEWPVADHSEAQGAFARLITRGSRHRLLSVHGHSETGKSHLTRQFVRNALKIEHLACGRFDFKGSTDRAAPASTFAEQLGVAAPDHGGTGDRLRQIFEALKRRATPTLLVFDTFEMAGEAERWVKESLLMTLPRCAWLRVIVVGQAALQPHGETWADWGASPIELKPPSAQEWFDFGCRHQTGLTLDFVHELHARVSGKSVVMAQVLGPR